MILKQTKEGRPTRQDDAPYCSLMPQAGILPLACGGENKRMKMSAESYFRCLSEAADDCQAPRCERTKEIASQATVALELCAELDEKVSALYTALGYYPTRTLEGELIACPVCGRAV